ncbi:MAG: nitrate reductase associated protein [Thermostichus sp. HHBFW_bins_43]
MSLFQFEQDFADSLRCIPMSVRLKLDLCGVKLKLHQWARFSAAQKQQCVDWPDQTAQDIEQFGSYLRQLIHTVCREEAKEFMPELEPEWENTERIPLSVQQKAEEIQVQITLEFWRRLQNIQRFALIKLSRSNHENKNFLPALQEFGLKPEGLNVK